MTIKTKFNDSKSAPNVVQKKKEPMLLGLSVKHLILLYHVVFFLVQIDSFIHIKDKKFNDIVWGIITVICISGSFYGILTENKKYIKFHYWYCIFVSAIPVAFLQLLSVGIIHRLVTGEEGFLSGEIMCALKAFGYVLGFVMIFFLYIWMCYKLHKHLANHSMVLPYSAKDVHVIYNPNYDANHHSINSATI
ncbi:hypothetical protein CRE_25291 [Caenorhabditis remanei]|uniref:Uncharacterized protein n=2 Tax=Caenorhabditis remanei TaxID=31234 RepID=E3LSC6_CAERE|nr:hypothetical protein CRE_25291 [Caenorhabditis remanei]